MRAARLAAPLRVAFTHMKEPLRAGSPDTQRGPHPPDTGYTPGVSELCRTHTHIHTHRHTHTHTEGAAETQPGVGVLGTAAADGSPGVKTANAEETFSGYRRQHKRTSPGLALNGWMKYITITAHVMIQCILYVYMNI